MEIIDYMKMEIAERLVVILIVLIPTIILLVWALVSHGIDSMRKYYDKE